MKSMNLHDLGIHCTKIFRNLSIAKIYEYAIKSNDCLLSNKGALSTYSKKKTGRSPNDKRIIISEENKEDVFWGDVNIPISSESYAANKKTALDFLNRQKQLYVFDGFAGSDPNYRIKIRVICTRPYHYLFMKTMLIRPTKDELAHFGDPHYVIYNAGCQEANPEIDGNDSKTSVCISFRHREVVILGTEYAGEMKKGVFTIANYIFPKKNILTMHCSANEGEGGDVSIFFGLSGTGKTTLSADAKRKLIGDDEHYWTKEGINNIEGGCYAKCMGLSEKKEPEIFNAIKFGSIMENVVLDPYSHEPDYDDTKITENTRVAYPIHFIPNAKNPSQGGVPKNILFLTCDAFGILPPVSKLTSLQASYWFISGYTAKVAGTEVGIKSPVASFSACFGSPFMVFHPNKYAMLLDEKIQETQCQTWLINTGWIGGGYGVGERIKLKHTRKIIDAIHSGDLIKQPTKVLPIFEIDYIEACEGIPENILCPYKSWHSRKEYNEKSIELAKLFIENFKNFKKNVNKSIIQAGPKILN